MSPPPPPFNALVTYSFFLLLSCCFLGYKSAPGAGFTPFSIGNNWSITVLESSVDILNNKSWCSFREKKNASLFGGGIADHFIEITTCFLASSSNTYFSIESDGSETFRLNCSSGFLGFRKTIALCVIVWNKCTHSYG